MKHVGLAQPISSQYSLLRKLLCVKRATCVSVDVLLMLSINTYLVELLFQGSRVIYVLIKGNCVSEDALAVFPLHTECFKMVFSAFCTIYYGKSALLAQIVH